MTGSSPSLVALNSRVLGAQAPGVFVRSVLPSRLACGLRWWPGEASDVPASLHTGVCGGCANVLGTLALHSSLVRGAWTGTPGQVGAGPCLHSPASPRSSRTASCTRAVQGCGRRLDLTLHIERPRGVDGACRPGVPAPGVAWMAGASKLHPHQLSGCLLKRAVDLRRQRSAG